MDAATLTGLVKELNAANAAGNNDVRPFFDVASAVLKYRKSRGY